MENNEATMETVKDFLYVGSKMTTDGDCSHEIKRGLLLGWKVTINLEQHIKKQRHYFADKSPSIQSYVFSNNHVWMWQLDHKESGALKYLCFWTVVLKTLESPIDCKEFKPPVSTKRNRSYTFTAITVVEAEDPILSPADMKNWLVGKDRDAGKSRRQEEKGMTEDEIVC